MNNTVKLNSSSLIVGDNIYYSDAHNIMQYEITEIFTYGFEIKNLDSDCPVEYQIEYHQFDDLQYGWYLSNNTILRINNNWNN
jgi:hypothetical protein